MANKAFLETGTIDFSKPCISDEIDGAGEFCMSNSNMEEGRRSEQMNVSWYSAYMAMQYSRHSDLVQKVEQLDKETSISENDDSRLIEEVDDMMKQCSYSYLQHKLVLMQHQLSSYHSLLDELDKSKSRVDDLENEVVMLKSEHAERISRTRKLASCYKKTTKRTQSMENEIVQLKLEIAQSKTEEDHSKAHIKEISAKNESLKAENNALQDGKFQHFCAAQM